MNGTGKDQTPLPGSPEWSGDGIDAKHKGARNELVAICWLMSLGYEVFRNVSQHGAADVIATRGDEMLLLDIKSANMNYSPSGTAEQVFRGVKLLLVSPEGTCRIVDWRNSGTTRLCKMCGGSITAKRRNIYCSPFCQHRAQNERIREMRAAGLWKYK